MSLRIPLQFPEFHVENLFDYVYVYEGWEMNPSRKLLQWTGMRIPPAVVSATNRMLVVFTSDFSGQRPGFLASYRACKNV